MAPFQKAGSEAEAEEIFPELHHLWADFCAHV